MKKEYNFSEAQRGKFYRKGAKLRLPIYLDLNLQNRLQRIAQKNHQPLGEMVHRMLKKEVHLVH